MNSLTLKHMKVIYNHETQKLVYNRKLCDGAGDSIYGLEVCKSLNMPDDFIKDVMIFEINTLKIQITF